MKNTSINNYAINKSIGIDSKVQDIVKHIFKSAPTSNLTNNEMVLAYNTLIDDLPANTPEEKAMISSIQQGLKGARSALTDKGTLRVTAERHCTVSNRECEAYSYFETEYTAEEQITNDIERRTKHIERNTKAIEKLKIELAELRGNGQN